jgi:DNA polymerase-3 subunit delta'
MLELEKQYARLPWLEEQRAQLDELVKDDRCPHALLIQGKPGMGRRHLALWLATTVLGSDPSRLTDPDDPESEAGHPDFIEVRPEAGKKSIGIDQIRQLIEFFALTSFGTGGRVAIIYPADAMTIAAANSLLKTLEEPAGKSLIILVTESLRRLPPTIVSRCQRLRLPAPPAKTSLAWLEGEAPGAKLANMLDFVGGAPLAALELHEGEFAATANSYAADIKALENRQLSPVVVADRWKSEPDLALEWLYWRLAGRVRQTFEAAESPARGDLAANRPYLEACFRQMAQIRELRRLISRGISAELNLAGLLMDWYGGLGQR